MTLREIKDAVEAGKTVHYGNKSNTVLKDKIGQWYIVCDANQYAIGLTHKDGKTMNGKPEEFFVA